jgi:MiaB/RimO family radical SAM methylthiotransferase
MDTAMLFQYFKENGWESARDVAQADLSVVATCGFDEGNRRESLRLLSLVDKRRKKGSKLVVVGCLPGIEPDVLHKEFNAETVGPAEINRLDEIVGARIPLREVEPVNDTAPLIAAAREHWGFLQRHPTLADIRDSVSRWFRRRRGGVSHTSTYYIRIARGCAEECTYCAIRFSSGQLRSKPPERVLMEFNAGLKKGYKRFELIAEDIGPYGLDIGTDCVELLGSVFARPGDFQVVLTDINPRYMVRYESRMIDLLKANARRVRLLRTPIQSGSDRILQLMCRQYTTAEVIRCLTHLRQEASSIPLDTHVLVGFPGETDRDFQATISLLKAIRFDSIQIYRYADRPRTRASIMTDKVPPEVIDRRVQTVLRQFRQAFC